MRDAQDIENIATSSFVESMAISPALFTGWIAFTTLTPGWAILTTLPGAALLGAGIVRPLFQRKIRADIARFHLGIHLDPSLRSRAKKIDPARIVVASGAFAGLPALGLTWLLQNLLAGIVVGLLVTDIVSAVWRYRAMILYWRAFGVSAAGYSPADG
jgi:hypothetical protein